MYGKIIQVSKQPLNADDYVEESAFYDNFCGWIADYVDDEVDSQVRDEVISGFLKVFGNDVIIRYGNDQISFKVNDGWKEKYFSQQLQYIKDYIQLATVESMMNGFTQYELEKHISDPFGTYIYEEGYGLTTLQVWLRYMAPETPYFFGAVIDYHY